MNIEIVEYLKESLKEFFSDKSVALPGISLELPPPNLDADFAINCFKLAQSFKKKPEIIADATVEILSSIPSVEKIEKIKAFVNVKMKSEELQRQCLESSEKILSTPFLPTAERTRVLIEFSSPNTNKPLHLGHLRNNAIGDSISALFKRAGHDLIKTNLVNDRGIHICKSMIAYQLYGNASTPESLGVKGDHFVGDFYVKFDSELRKQIEELKIANPELKEIDDDALFAKTAIGSAAQGMLKKWEAGDSATLELWRTMNSWVLNGFNQTYSRMRIKFDKIYFESETYLEGKKIVEEGLQKGIFLRRDDNAIFADLEKFSLGKKILLRSDGTSVYITQDIGTTLIKQNEFSPNQQIWVVGDEQIHHFKTLFSIMKILGFEWADRLTHLSYGMVNLPSGRMKSREGSVVDADDLFDELFSLAKNATIERFEGKELPQDIDERAEIISMGALKFMLLKFNPKTTVTFDPQASVKFEGDTGPYVQYACARISSILKKCEKNDMAYKPDLANFAGLSSKEERELVVRMALYRTALLQAVDKLDVSIIANYLLDLAKAFNRFYREHSVMNAENEGVRNARLKLSIIVRDTLSDGLSILGIEVPDAM